MKSRALCICAVALFLALVPVAQASTTWFVNGVTGNDSNDCKSSTTACKTIGHAISLAASGDSISVAAAVYRENLTIGINLKLVGAGATTTIIDGGGHGTVVTISGQNVALSRVTIQDGDANTGGGIYNLGTLVLTNTVVSQNLAALGGGGIYNTGILTINNSSITGNRAVVSSGNGATGGGIDNTGTLTINNSTFSGNQAGGNCFRFCTPPSGGGIDNTGTLTVNNSTLSGNTAFNTHQGGGPAFGGGIANNSKLTINNSTISGNAGNLIGGISGSATIQNSIIANGPSWNCGGALTSTGFNLSSDGTCNFNSTGDLNNTDPLLGPLQNNGGPTQTQALLPGSPAIDAGNPNGCTDSNGHLLKTDQRGAPRPDKEDTAGCDMGAYERRSD
jgi:hypothetical protein